MSGHCTGKDLGREKWRALQVEETFSHVTDRYVKGTMRLAEQWTFYGRTTVFKMV